RTPRVLQEPENIERRRLDAEAPAEAENGALVLGRNRPPAGFFQRRGIERLDAEAHRAKSRAMQRLQQRFVETIETGFAFEPQLQAARDDLVGERKASRAILREERVAKDHVRVRMAVAQVLELFDDAGDRSFAVASENPVRAVRAEFGTPAAGQH